VKINSILDIIGGKLLNSPSISFIYSLKTKLSKVKEGDLFIAYDLDDVQEAVKKGAFAIITQNIYPIIDKEIAWIRVESIELCIIKLIRYKLANFNLDAFICDEITYDLLNIYSNNSNKTINFIDNDMNDFLDDIDNISNGDILISKNEDIINKVYPNNQLFQNNKYDVSNVIQHSIFEISFTFENEYFQKLRLPTIYLNSFLNVFNFLNKNEFDYSKLKSLKHFKPIFLDKSLNMVDFGKSDKFILVQNSEELIQREVTYIKNSFSYGKLSFITSSFMKKRNEESIVVENLSSLKAVLKNETFNCIYIMGHKLDDVYNKLIKTEEEVTLF
jgi:ferrochelatase